MKRYLLFLFVLFSINFYSQGIVKYNAVTTSQTGGRYEILQSEIKRSNTFKLDKYTGKVYVFVKTKNDWFSWQEVPKDSSDSDVILSDKINYQLFMGGVMASDCFLININTGITWVLVENKKTNSFSFSLF